MIDALAKLQTDVIKARKVVTRIRQPPLGLATPLPVLGDACRLLEKTADILWTRLNDARDHALFDDRVGARPQARAQKQVDHVLAANIDIVDEIIRFTAAVKHPLDRDLGIA